jgi:hypothetical protein
MRRRELLLTATAMMAARAAHAQQRPIPWLVSCCQWYECRGCSGVPSGSERNRLGRRMEPEDRVPLG